MYFFKKPIYFLFFKPSIHNSSYFFRMLNAFAEIFRILTARFLWLLNHTEPKLYDFSAFNVLSGFRYYFNIILGLLAILSIFQVAKIRAVRQVTKGKSKWNEYLVRWKGYGAEEDQWLQGKHLKGCRYLMQSKLHCHCQFSFEAKLHFNKFSIYHLAWFMDRGLLFSPANNPVLNDRKWFHTFSEFRERRLREKMKDEGSANGRRSRSQSRLTAATAAKVNSV